MKSLRLNREIRQSILEAFHERYLEANPEPEITLSRNELREKLALACWEEVYGSYNIEGIPQDLLNTDCSINVQFPNGDISLLFFPKREDGRRISLLSTNESKVEYVISKDFEGYKEYKKGLKLYKEQQEVLKSYNLEAENYLTQVGQVLSGVNTTGQLLEVWAEAEQFIPDSLKNPSVISVPSVNVADLNSKIKQ